MSGGLFIAGTQVPPLPLEFITQSSAILAKKGAGKTNAAIVLLEEVHAAGVPVVSIDPKGDHWGVRAGADGSKKGGLPVVVFGGLHADVPLEPTAGAYVADAAGFFLTDAGFEYLGGRPAPMTAEELQQHYRTILRAGAVRMLDAIMARYPDGIEIDVLGDQIEMSTKSGTFSTYKGELIRNGLATQNDGVLTATDILMKGAAA